MLFPPSWAKSNGRGYTRTTAHALSGSGSCCRGLARRSRGSLVDAVVTSFELSTGRGARNSLDFSEARGFGAGGHEQVLNVAAQGPTQPGTVQPVATVALSDLERARMNQGSAHLAVAHRCWGSLAEFWHMLPYMVEGQLPTNRLTEVSELEPEVLCAPRARFRATSNQCDAARL